MGRLAVGADDVCGERDQVGKTAAELSSQQAGVQTTGEFLKHRALSLNISQTPFQVCRHTKSESCRHHALLRHPLGLLPNVRPHPRPSELACLYGLNGNLHLFTDVWCVPCFH